MERFAREFILLIAGFRDLFANLVQIRRRFSDLVAPEKVVEL